MYVRKWINIEGIAKLEYCKAVPFAGLDWSEMRDQMNATNDGLDLNNTGRPLPIPSIEDLPVGAPIQSVPDHRKVGSIKTEARFWRRKNNP